ncbi:MAG: fasciclin domain-containing protein [Anaerolinea sp.]|nr:fasciclin domain-containing protein [Anaerolinea sp.]CAG0964095.1 Immunogenic protein MPT70 [Anaerolineae bacterium]
MKRVVLLMLVAVIVLGGFSVAKAQDAKTIAEIVVESAGAATPEFATLLAAVQAADPAVLEALSNKDAKLTVFAPTDAAFAALKEALGEDAFAGILADQAALSGILLFHVLDGEVMSADVVAAFGEGNRFQVPSLNGQVIDIAKTEEGGITINGAPLNLKMVDIKAANGVIHVIDAVMVPESRTIAELVVEAAGAAEGAEFTTLLAAVSAADPAVLETLSNPEAELTVFAPTDAAFAALKTALGEEAFNAILADKTALTNILLYHVVPMRASSFDVVKLLGMEKSMEVETALEGSKFTVKLGDDGSVMINDAKVVVFNIDAANGVIHVIDAVIVPPTK